MNIDGRWHIDDTVSGLRLHIIEGDRLDHLHIEILADRIATNRDFYFRKDGTFDGTGTGVSDDCKRPDGRD